MKESCYVEAPAPLTVTQQPVFPPPHVLIPVWNALFLFGPEQISCFKALPHNR